MEQLDNFEQVEKMRLVITIGGSIILKDEAHHQFQSYADVLRNVQEEHEIWVVVGGGVTARQYISMARSIGVSEAQCDDIGIEVTRLNARLLIMALDDAAYPKVPRNFIEAQQYAQTGKIVVMGGTEPAHSTDAVGAILAEFVGAQLLINLTAVEGLYDKDPKIHPDAQFFQEVTATEMLEILGSKEVKAGTYEFFDHTAIQIIKRSGINTIIANGKEPKNLKKAIAGKTGTHIKP